MINQILRQVYKGSIVGNDQSKANPTESSDKKSCPIWKGINRRNKHTEDTKENIPGLG